MNDEQARGAWFGDPDLKARTVEKMKKHRALDEIHQGSFQAVHSGKFTGCAIGCMLPRQNGLGTHFRDCPEPEQGWHQAAADTFGLTRQVAEYIEGAFESISTFDAAAAFAVEVIEAIPVGANLLGVEWDGLYDDPNDLLNRLAACPLTQVTQ